MNNFMLRPRALKAGSLSVHMSGSSSVIAGVGWGTKMVRNPNMSDYYTTYHGWGADKWGVPVPGVYRAMAQGAAGGGGAAGATGAPGFVNDGFGGGGGNFSEVRRYIRTSSYISVGVGGAGGDYLAGGSPSVNGEPGSAGLGSSIGTIVSASGGYGGNGGSTGNPASPSQQLGTPGGYLSPYIYANWGGDGGTSGGGSLHSGRSGGSGGIYLQLVG